MRVFGSGIPAPGAQDWPDIAELHARITLEAHLDLLAPGARPEDFLLVTNDLTDGIRTVGFQQTWGGIPVRGGQVSFRFVRDRLVVLASEALPWVSAEQGQPVDAPRAARLAGRWVSMDYRVPTHVRGVSGPVVLPLVPDVGARSRAAIRYALVWVVDVDAPSLPGRWEVYADATDGRPVARRQTLRFASGRIRFDAPVRWPDGGREATPAPWANVTVDASVLTTDMDGFVSFDGTQPVSVVLSPAGPYAEVTNDAGPGATTTLTLSDGGEVTWDVSEDEYADSQLASFVHANQAKAFLWAMGVDLPWLSQSIPIIVNIDDTCNAFFDGQAINFYRSSNYCENTGRLADVVYHEFGHAVHYRAILAGVGSFDDSLSEGLSDTLAASITGDSGMGRGFFYDSQPLREIDPVNREAVWPDDMGQDSHTTGLIISGALWDLRKALVADHGEAAGVDHFLHLFWATVQRASDIPSAYAEVLAADDDDGDLSNGTPNLCAIQRTFEAHGIAGDEAMVGGLLLGTPQLNERTVSLSVEEVGVSCDIVSVESIVLNYYLRDQTEGSGSVEMVSTDSGYEADLPEVPEGNVVRYQVAMTFSNGTERVYPRNPADSWYETFVGATFPLYCTNFEGDPESEGWTHGLSGGSSSVGADDWTWGPPRADPSSGDPPEAFSGTRVFGNDLGGGTYDGKYQRDKRNWAATPVVDVSEADVVRLQYRRWLSVEDGYYDHATIYANDMPVWQNANSNQGEASAVHHQDHEWRFHDVDLTPYVDEYGLIQVKFELESDSGLQMGGWTLDDLCIVAWLPPRCGDGRVSAGEECDDGTQNSNVEPDACRTRCLRATCGDGVVDSDEECDDGNSEAGDGCSETCVVEDNPKPNKGCGCSGQTGDGLPASAGLFLLALVGLAFRRRR